MQTPPQTTVTASGQRSALGRRRALPELGRGDEPGARSFGAILGGDVRADGATVDSASFNPPPKSRRDEGDQSTSALKDSDHDTPPDDRTAPVSARELQLQQQPLNQGALVMLSPAGGRSAINPAVQEIARQMLRNVSVQQLGQTTDLHLKIETRRIPALGLNLKLERGKLQACFRVADRAGQDLLRAMAPELEAALEIRGIEVNKIQVQGEASPPHRQRQGGEGGASDDPSGGGKDEPVRVAPHHHRSRRPTTTSSTDYIK